MSKTTRRRFVKRAAAVVGGICAAELTGGVALLSAGTKATDARVERISYSYQEHVFRAPLKFARAVVDRITLLTVQCTVRTVSGKVATVFGTLPLNYTFSFPSKKVPPDDRLGAMRALAEQIAKITGAYKESAHPIDINWQLAPAYVKAAATRIANTQRIARGAPCPPMP